MDAHPPYNIDTNVCMTLQPELHPPSIPKEDPDDFYRAPSLVTNHGADSDQPSTSPADSQAPIMASWRMTPQNNQDVQRSTSVEPPVSPVSAQPEDQQNNEGILYFPPPPSAAYVNGEIGAVPTPQSVTLPVAPLSAGLKTAGTTIEEQRVAELEEKAQIADRKDLAIKLKVRLAKVALRSVNCACSLVVLALVSSTFAIFFATRHLPARNNLPPWAINTPQWPQTAILVISTMSLILSLYIMYCYWRGGHSKAERIAMHATLFTAAAFIFGITIWSVGIGIMQGSRGNSNGQDLWGWSCKDNTRKNLFKDTINYDLVCRQQNWVVLCAIIEISVEFLIACIYVFAFYRLVYSKRKLRKSLNVRDEARSSLWLAKLQSQKEEENEIAPDHQTAMNTTYNQLNSNTAIIDAEEGRIRVPILQAPPTGHQYKQTATALTLNAGNEVLTAPPVIPAAVDEPSPYVPSTPRSVSFQPQVDVVPPTPRSVSFQPSPNSAETRER